MTRLWGLRWWMMGLLMVGSIINYLTRSTLAVAAPSVLKDLDISTQQYSWILSAFQVAIMLQPICGYVMDTVGLKLGFAIFAIAWSFISMAHGLAGSWQALFGLRALLGFAEGSANPAGMKATSEWFPATERGLAGGVFNMGASLGSMLAAPLVAWAILTHSWQFAFVLTGVHRPRLGRVVAGLLPVAVAGTRGCRLANGTTSCPGRRRTWPERAGRRSGRSSASGISGASRSPGSSPIRPGAR